MEADSDLIRVEVAYALADEQALVSLSVPAGTTALDAIRRSGLAARFSEIVPERCSVGIFSRPVALDHRLRDGDRVEIYRPLKADPKEVRRKLAAEGKVMGRRGRKS